MKIADYNQMMAYLTRPEPLPLPKPEELLKIQEQNRIDRLRKTMEEIGPGLMDESVDFIEREEFNRGSDYFTSRVTDPERLKFLNEAAKKFGYDSWADVPKTKPVPGKRAYGDREKIAQEATRRQKGVVEGKGKVKPSEATKAKIKKSHWANKSEAEVDKILGSPKQRAYWAKKTQNQLDILKMVQSGKYKTSEDIRKAVGFTEDVFKKEVKNLFKNVYTHIGDLNKPKKMQSRFGVNFLPRDLGKMYKLRSQLGQIEGFESVDQRNIYQQIEEAYGQKGTNPNRKAYAESIKKASDFSRIKNAISAKYPNIKLELDHPLDYKTIKGLGKEGEKFLFVTPVEKSINRGFKATLGDAYAKAVKAKDMDKILKIEKLADDIGVTVGKVRGTKVMDYGTGPLRTTNLGNEIITNLRQQNVIVDNIKKLEKSGELKVRLTDIGMPRAGESGYSTKKVSEAQIKNINKIIASIACPGKAMGGRIGFEDGTSCFEKGKKMINTGNIPEGAAKRNFINFANKAMEIGKQSGRGLRTITKFGVLPEMVIIGADTLIRTGMGDTLNEAFLRASDIYRTDDAYEQADASEINRRMNSNDGELILNLRKFNREKQKLDSIEQAKAADLALAGDEFGNYNIGMTEEEIEKLYAPRLQEQKNNVFNASISDAEERAGLAKETEFADKKGVAYKKSPIGAYLDYIAEKPAIKPITDFFATDVVREPDVGIQALSNVFRNQGVPEQNIRAFEKGAEENPDTARQLLDYFKSLDAKPLPEGMVRTDRSVADEERKILFELAKTDTALAERLGGANMTFFGDPIDSTDLQDEMNLDRGIYALGGRIGFADGPKNPGRRTFMKIVAGLASIPVLGKFLKPAGPAIQKLVNTSTKMPEWFPDFINKISFSGFGKKIDADLTLFETKELPGIQVFRHDDGRVFVEGSNQYGKGYKIEYEPPGYEVIDDTTGKSVKKPGEFIAEEEVPVNVDPDGNADFDVDVLEDLDQILGPDTRAMEEFATGKKIKDMKKGEFAVGKAEADADRAIEEAAELSDEID